MAKKGSHRSRDLNNAWLDDRTGEGKVAGQRSKFSSRAHKDRQMKVGKSKRLDPGEANATVAEVFMKMCRVRLDSNGQSLLCPYRRADVYHGSGDTGFRERTPVAVGDRVKVTAYGSKDGVVDGVCERGNFLVRQAPGREEGVVHVIAANLDLLVIVVSVIEPAFSPGLVDRYLIGAREAGIPVLICLNKADLLEPGQPRPTDLYASLGYEIAEVSAKAGLGIGPLRERLTGIRVAFCGHSGVGKTSLLQKLLESEVGRVGVVNSVTGKGKHTTSGAYLFDGPGGAFWIDTPGVRGFGLVRIQPETLREYFPDLNQAGCEISECLHQQEPGCRAKTLPRWESYTRIHDSLTSGEG
jgi:ribosome biogenesis GTPase